MMVNTAVDLVEEGKIDTLLLPLSWWDMGSVQFAKTSSLLKTFPGELLENNYVAFSLL